MGANVALLRGGALLVDNEGNFYSPPAVNAANKIRGGGANEDVDHQDKFSLPKRRRQALPWGRAKKPQEKELSSTAAEIAAGLKGGYIHNDRLGALCVDNDGNLYCPP